MRWTTTLCSSGGWSGCRRSTQPAASRGRSRGSACRWAGTRSPSSRCSPLVGAGLWLTGGADAYLGPMLVLPMLYVAYFFPARYVWPLAVLKIATYASPLLSSPGPHHLLLPRTLAYAVAYAGVVGRIQFLKRRLVAAERHQHRIARVDPLT